ncbi:MAG: HTH domain-containing protein [Firmicutes bacterium]|nr:HTH domain-containing protein [Bacillota bacterium]
MAERLCVSERRTKILEHLALKKISTYSELAETFNVSVNTISRDIDYLSRTAPIYTKQGNNGGVYILPEYRSYKNYLTKKEENCLCGLMKKADEEEKHILNAIIIKFSMCGS